MASSGWRACMKHLYDFSTANGYIQEERLALNIILPKYLDHDFKPVPFQVTINCSKPEIIVGQTPAAAHYSNFAGQCVICFENVGSEKRLGLRAYEFECNGKKFFRQFPPYPYFNLHNIIIDKSHEPQVLSIDTIRELLGMAGSMPGYSVASNSDREGTGVTNLSHRHYQAGDHRFAVYDAAVKREYYQDSCLVQWLDYPSACLRVVGARANVERTAHSLFTAWRTGSFPTLIKELQTCSLIATMDAQTGDYSLLIFARNAEQPRFLTRPTLQCIKKEFVGIFELCGFAILPSRLKEQMAALNTHLSSGGGHLANELPADLAMFSTFLQEYYLPAQQSGLSVTLSLEKSLQDAFITILKDNSPIACNDRDLMDLWIAQSIDANHTSS
eukprot:gene13247-15567_t